MGEQSNLGVDELEKALSARPKSVAKALGCSERHVRNMVTAGQLPSFRLGKSVFIPTSAVKDLLQSAYAVPPEQAEDMHAMVDAGRTAASSEASEELVTTSAAWSTQASKVLTA